MTEKLQENIQSTRGASKNDFLKYYVWRKYW